MVLLVKPRQAGEGTQLGYVRPNPRARSKSHSGLRNQAQDCRPKLGYHVGQDMVHSSLAYPMAKMR